MDTTTQTTTSQVHKFERAGLGVAPYAFTGYAALKFQACPGAPIKPGGSCDYCSTAIVDAYYFRSADGRTFKVGSDCVLKAGDRGMVDMIKKAAAKVERDKRHAREAVKVAAVRTRLADPAVRAALATLPHPRPSTYTPANATALDWADWMMANAGDSGRMQVGRTIDRLLK
jgi:hypothetical protein